MIPSENRLLRTPSAAAREAIANRLAHARQREAIVSRFARACGRELSTACKAACLAELHQADRQGTADALLDQYSRQAANLEATSAALGR